MEKPICKKCNKEMPLIETVNGDKIKVEYIPEDANLIGKLLQYGDNGLEVIPLKFGRKIYQCSKCKHIVEVAFL